MDEMRVYEDLAAALNRLPHGFPRTPSRAEIPLLQEIFRPDQARLAGTLSERFESADEIARRQQLHPDDTETALLGMARRGLVWVKGTPERKEFRLAPFVVGIYEAQLARMDERLAALVDAYLQDGGAVGIMGAEPAIHRVLPAQASLKPEWVLPYEDVKRILSTAKTFRVRDCICRVHMDKIGRDCDFPLNMCLSYSTQERPPSPKDISREQAFELLDRAEEVGLVHTVSNVQVGALLPHENGYVCNCCGCCCLVLRGITKWGVANSVAHASYRARLDAGTCTDCGICVDRCQVNALARTPEGVVLDPARCIGCGLCVSTCPTEAMQLERRPEEDILVPPRDLADWEEARRRGRGSPTS